MKKLILAASGIVCLVGATYFVGSVWGQGATKAAAPEAPHKIGLIDMASVFSRYKKFEVLREDLRTEILQIEQEFKAKEERLKAVQGELQSGTFKQGSPEYLNREKELVRLSTEFESSRKLATQDFARKEASIYHTVYLEVEDAIKKYCSAYQYTVVLRFSREDITSNDPAKIPTLLNRQVVYFRPEDDLTDSVLEYLNKKYGTPPARPTSPGASPKTSSPQIGTPTTKPGGAVKK